MAFVDWWSRRLTAGVEDMGLAREAWDAARARCGTTEPFLVPGEWYDYDQAACALLLALGAYRTGSTFGPAKWVFASKSPLGDAVYALLDQLVRAGCLESDGACCYRWREGYDPAKLGDTAPVPGEGAE